MLSVTHIIHFTDNLLCFIGTSTSSNTPPPKLAKIRPPRLHGQKVGCLSTRSPHRPNEIGLSVCEIVSVGPDYLELRAVDMVHGTPILDGKLPRSFFLSHADLYHLHSQAIHPLRCNSI